MKVTLSPLADQLAPLKELSFQGKGDFTPVQQVLERVAQSRGRLIRMGKHTMLVDLEQHALNEVMPDLRGWIAEPVVSTSEKTAFQGALTYHLGKRK